MPAARSTMRPPPLPAVTRHGQGGSDTRSGEYLNFGAFGEKRGIGIAPQYFREFWAVERRGVAFEIGAGGGPDAPRIVGDLVFECRAVGLTRVAPVVFGDELGERCGGRVRGQAGAFQ